MSVVEEEVTFEMTPRSPAFPSARATSHTLPSRRRASLLSIATCLVALAGTGRATPNTIPVGHHPGGIAVDSYFGDVLVANHDPSTPGGNESVSEFRGSLTPPSINGLGYPNGRGMTGVAVKPADPNPNGGPSVTVVYITNSSDDSLSVLECGALNLSNGSLIQTSCNGSSTFTIPVGHHPTGVAVNPKTNLVYVANSGDDTVSVIVGAQRGNNPCSNCLTVTAVVNVGASPAGVAVSPDNGLVYVANSGDGTVSVIKTTDNSVRSVPVGHSPYGVAVNPGMHRLYVTNAADNTVSVLTDFVTTTNSDGNRPVATVPVGHAPHGIAVNTSTGTVFVANSGGDTVSVISSFNAVAGILSVGHAPEGVAVKVDKAPGAFPADASMNLVFVTNSGDDTVSAFPEPTPEMLFDNLIYVPVRWCVLEGTPTAGADADGNGGTAPGGTVDATPLLMRLEQANEIWVPQAHIMFTSPNADKGIPVIADPTTPATAGSIFRRGDIDEDPYHKDLPIAAASCVTRWHELYGDEAKGLPVINVREYILLRTHSSHTGGSAPVAISLTLNPIFGMRGDDLCGQPRHLRESDLIPAEWVTVMDPVRFSARDFHDYPQTLAHELGHALLLGHGNGVDDNGDGLAPQGHGFSLTDNPGRRRYDTFCDAEGAVTFDGGEEVPAEDCETQPNPTKDTCHPRGLSLMAHIGVSHVIQPLQIEQARAAASKAPGHTGGEPDPEGELVRRPPCAHPPCGLPPGVFTFLVTMSETPGSQTTDFTHTILDIPSNASNEYLIFADLDHDSATGCAPSGLGFPTSFHGAELVTRVVVAPVGGVQQATPSVWQCQGGSLVAVADPRVTAHVVQQGLFIIAIHMPNAIRGPAADRVRIQSLALESRSGGQLDRLPATDAGDEVSLVPPALRPCSATPVLVQPGGMLTVTAAGLPPNHTIAVDLGAQQIGTGSTDGTGYTQVDVLVPSDTTGAVRQVTVHAPGTGATAACAVAVLGGPLCVGGAACTAFDDCHDAGSCDPQSGLCTGPQRPDGLSCDDGVTCTLNDTCLGGICVGQDISPPSMTCSVTTPVLWRPFPPSHELVDAGLNSTATDACDGPRPVDVAVFGNEDDQARTDSTATIFSPDAADIAPGTLRLRNERIDSGGGRVYLVVTKATDRSGNTGFACCTVGVPHDLSARSVKSIKRQAAAANAFCSSHNGSPPAGYFVIGDGPVIGKKQ